MESPKILCKIDKNVIRKRSELKGVSLTKPRLVAYYSKDYNILKPTKNVLYFKKPNFKNYPIDLNDGFDTFIRRQCPLKQNELSSVLQYAMSSRDEIYNFENVDKIKIFTRSGTLANIMFSYYSKEKCTVRVYRYNGDIYMIHHKAISSKFKKANTHHEQLLKNVFTGE